MKKLFLSQGKTLGDKARIIKLLTPANFKDESSAKGHFIKSIEFGIGKNETDPSGFVKKDTLAGEDLESLLYIFSFVHYRKQHFFVYDYKTPDGDYFSDIKENVRKLFFQETDKWDLKEGQIKMISAAEVQNGLFISFAYADWEKNYVDASQKIVTVNKLSVVGIYISKWWFVTVHWLSKKGAWKALSSKLEFIVDSKLTKRRFGTVNFSAFKQNIRHLTRAKSHNHDKWTSYNTRIVRADSESDVGNIEIGWRVRQLGWYPSKEEFGSINVSMTHKPTFPENSFSILKDCTDESLSGLIEYLYSNVLDTDVFEFGNRIQEICSVLVRQKLSRWIPFVEDEIPEHFDASWIGQIICPGYLVCRQVVDKHSHEIITREDIVVDDWSGRIILPDGTEVKASDDWVSRWYTLNPDWLLFKEPFRFDEDAGAFIGTFDVPMDRTKKAHVIFTERWVREIRSGFRETGDMFLVVSAKEDYSGDEFQSKFGQDTVGIKWDSGLFTVWQNPELAKIFLGFFDDVLAWKKDTSKHSSIVEGFFDAWKIDVKSVVHAHLKWKPAITIAKYFLGQYKDYLEQNKGWRLVQDHVSAQNLRKELKDIRNRNFENFVQGIFHSRASGYYGTIFKEPNHWPGPADFILCEWASKVVMEFKMAENALDDFEWLVKQTEKYKKSSDSNEGVMAIFCLNDDEFIRVDKKVASHPLKDSFIVINCSEQKPPSK